MLNKKEKKALNTLFFQGVQEKKFHHTKYILEEIYIDEFNPYYEEVKALLTQARCMSIDKPHKTENQLEREIKNYYNHLKEK